MSKHTISKDLGARLADATGLPLDVLGSQPVFQMYSDREMIVEGVQNLEYYDECLARMRTGTLCVCVYGRGLIIKCLANCNISVCGFIERIELERSRNNRP